MLYVIIILLYLILMIFINYLKNKDTSIVDGNIKKIEKTLTYRKIGTPKYYFKIIIVYCYTVNGKEYINECIDYFNMSHYFYKYIKENKKKKKNIYYVKKPNIKVRYKNNDPQNSIINNFDLKCISTFIIFVIFFLILIVLVSLFIWGLTWFIILYCSKF